jgi:hypothetical protein
MTESTKSQKRRSHRCSRRVPANQVGRRASERSGRPLYAWPTLSCQTFERGESAR